MAGVKHHFAGPATVALAANTAGTVGSFTDLGINRDAIPINIEVKFLDVPADDYGGEAGTPADVQILGGIATIDLELTKFELATIEKYLLGHLVTTAGTFEELGTFLRQQSKGFALKLTSTRAVRQFDFGAFIGGQPSGVSQGVRYSSYRLSYRALLDAASTRKLYAASTLTEVS